MGKQKNSDPYPRFLPWANPRKLIIDHCSCLVILWVCLRSSSSFPLRDRFWGSSFLFACAGPFLFHEEANYPPPALPSLSLSLSKGKRSSEDKLGKNSLESHKKICLDNHVWVYMQVERLLCGSEEGVPVSDSSSSSGLIGGGGVQGI